MSVIVRPAAERDAADLVRIYAPYTETAISFEYRTPDADEFAGRIRETSASYPFLICEADGDIVGYSYAHRLRDRAAFDWSAELSIYLDRAFTGLGIGKPLYTAVLDLLAAQGFRNAYGCIVPPNEKSERLHLACGFTEAGIWQKTGYKLGKWHDLKWFEKPIGDRDSAPAPIISFPMLDKASVLPILDICRADIESRISKKRTFR